MVKKLKDSEPEKLVIKLDEKVTKQILRIRKIREKKLDEEDISYNRIIRYIIKKARLWKDDDDDQ